MTKLLVAVFLVTTPTLAAAALRCPPDSVPVGPTCIDRYEASVWQVPQGKKQLIGKIQRGKVTLKELRDAGATQVSAMTQGTCSSVSYPATFANDGTWTQPLYAISVAGVLPTTCTSWFQAAQLCAIAGKRLLTNAEWQTAAAGTPDPGFADDLTASCAVASPFGVFTGSRASCRSTWGTRDMVGNAWEWVADWGEQATACGRWLPEMGDDLSCIGGDGELEPIGSFSSKPMWLRPAKLMLVEDPVPGANTPAGVIRGGNFAIGDRSGVYAFYQGAPLTARSRSTGFRCAR